MQKTKELSVKPSFLHTVKKHWILLLMLLPALAYVVIFSYIPMTGIVLAFKDYQYAGGIYNSPWSGLENFNALLVAGKLGQVTRNTLLYNIAFIVLGVVFEMGSAILLNEIVFRKFKKTAQTFMFLPYFISWVVAGAIMYNVFNYERGVVNHLLERLPDDVLTRAGRRRAGRPDLHGSVVLYVYGGAEGLVPDDRRGIPPEVYAADEQVPGSRELG